MKIIKWMGILTFGISISVIVFFSFLDLVSHDEVTTDVSNNKIKISNDNKDIDIQEPIKDDIKVTDIKIDLSEKNTIEFSVNLITEDIKNRINGISYKENNDISYNDLRYLKLGYYDFDGHPQQGEMIVHQKVANEVVAIFKDLYKAKYPIQQILLVDEFNGDDNLSMANNNTSAFNYRYKTNGTTLSNHAYGLAIDINPLQNPYVYKNSVLPEASKTFLDREYYQQGMILKDDICYTAFTSRGWSWGGDWQSLKDYQHFEKTTWE